MWNLSSPTRDPTLNPLEGEVLTIGPPGKSCLNILTMFLYSPKANENKKVWIGYERELSKNSQPFYTFVCLDASFLSHFSLMICSLQGPRGTHRLWMTHRYWGFQFKEQSGDDLQVLTARSIVLGKMGWYLLPLLKFSTYPLQQEADFYGLYFVFLFSH